MENNRIQERTDKNSDDIAQLAIQMASLAKTVESSEKRHEESLVTVKEAVKGIAQLNEKVTAIIALEKEIIVLKEAYNELKGDIRVYKHDLLNIQNAQGVLVPMKEAIDEAKLEIKVLKTWKDNINGGTMAMRIAITVLWMLFGAGILAVGHYWIQEYFLRHTTTTTTIIENTQETPHEGLRSVPIQPHTNPRMGN